MRQEGNILCDECGHLWGKPDKPRTGNLSLQIPLVDCGTYVLP